MHILRKHALGFAKARRIAFDWAEQVEKEFGMQCTYEEGKSADLVRFTRSGVHGELQVTRDKFELQVKLGFLLGAFKHRIEAEIIAVDCALILNPAPMVAMPTESTYTSSDGMAPFSSKGKRI